MEESKKVVLFTSYKTYTKLIPVLGSIIYTDGKIEEIKKIKKEAIKGCFVNSNVYSEEADSIKKEVITLSNANYIIYVYYKDRTYNINGGIGSYQVIVDVVTEIYNKKDKSVLKEVKDTLNVIKNKLLVRELGILESNTMKISYKNIDKVYSLSYSKYRKKDNS